MHKMCMCVCHYACECIELMNTVGSLMMMSRPRSDVRPDPAQHARVILTDDNKTVKNVS